MKKREQRWPTSWAFELRTREDSHVARVTNISASGMRFSGRVAARPGQLVKFKVLNEIVTGRVIRIGMEDGTVAFRKTLTPGQMNIMRQFREVY